MKPSRNALYWRIWTTLACAAALLASGGCTELGDDFRSAAGPNLQSGVTQVLTGMVDGAFAVFEPGKGDETTAGSTTGGG